MQLLIHFLSFKINIFIFQKQMISNSFKKFNYWKLEILEKGFLTKFYLFVIKLIKRI